MKENWNQTYRKLPLIVGKKYLVIKDFKVSKEIDISEGEVLEYIQSGYSRYDGMSLYQFYSKENKTIDLNLNDDENDDTWIKYLKELQ